MNNHIKTAGSVVGVAVLCFLIYLNFSINNSDSESGKRTSGKRFAPFLIFSSENPVPPKSTARANRNWQIYESPLFKASFPMRPNVSSLTGKPAEERGFTRDDFFSGHSGSSLFIVEAGELIPSSEHTAEKLLTHSRESLTSMLGIEVLNTSTEPFKGNKSFRIDYIDTLNSQYVKALFIYWEGRESGLPSRYFVLSELSSSKIQSSEFEAFIASFEVVFDD